MSLSDICLATVIMNLITNAAQIVRRGRAEAGCRLAKPYKLVNGKRFEAMMREVRKLGSDLDMQTPSPL